MKKKVVVGMSGGVDSSVAAYLLKEEGYDVYGVTMNIWQNEEVCGISDDGGCCGLSAVDDARRVCDSLNIPHYTMNFREDFKKSVIDYFVKAYLDGITPNPCIACNKSIKWESLLKRALSIGADYIATGHYAGIALDEKSGRYLLKRSKAQNKDQSYALYSLTQYQLAHTLMPLHSMTKDKVREIAASIGLEVAAKRDSQEICFVPDGDYGSFIERYAGITPCPGNFISAEGAVLGTHKGYFHYTVGQRKGLNIALGKRIYVKKTDRQKNEVTLVDDSELYSKLVFANELNFISTDNLYEKRAFNAKIRYNHSGDSCFCEITTGGLLKCEFDKPQRAITAGQALVLYDGDNVFGGGTII